MKIRDTKKRPEMMMSTRGWGSVAGIGPDDLDEFWSEGVFMGASITPESQLEMKFSWSGLNYAFLFDEVSDIQINPGVSDFSSSSASIDQTFTSEVGIRAGKPVRGYFLFTYNLALSFVTSTLELHSWRDPSPET